MTEKINGYGRTELPLSSAKTGGAKRADSSDSARGSGAADAGAVDAVALTETAVRLKRIESNLAELPDVDLARVDALRQQIEAGEYAINGSDVAQKLLQLDQDLA